MDSILSSALEEICSQGQNGLSLSSLWTRLHNTNCRNNNSSGNSTSLPIAPSLKSSVYSSLLKVPSLQFYSPENVAFEASDAAIQRLEDAEKLGLKIVAGSQLRDNFVGLYDTSATSVLSAPQRRVLERLAIARSNGITQSELAKELGIEGNNFFYVVKNLECKGLIVRRPAVLRTKEPGSSEGEPKNSSCVTTNLIYLYRYAKHLGSQQRLEISKEGPTVSSFENINEKAVNGDGFPEESAKEDVFIKDFLPAMKAICDKLEKANGKVLVVSDIKQDLGYCGSSSGHKAWRNICQRLKDAGIVEVFDAKVNEKVQRCLRLLKKFSSEIFEPKSLCGDNFENEELKFGRRIPKTEQLVELPIEHQIYDMVDARGSEGLAVMEVCDRLGIDKKKNYSRLCNMFSRFGMHLQAENHKKTVAFRVWTSGNSNSSSSNAFLSKLNPEIDNRDMNSCGPAQTSLENDHSTSEADFANPGVKKDVEINTGTSHAFFSGGENNHMLACTKQALQQDPSSITPQAELGLPSMEVEKNVSPTGKKLLALSKRHRNASPALTLNNLRREQRILERLQDDKVILRAELQKWLTSLEDTCTTIDRKCIERILVRLHQQGKCRYLNINVPVLKNCGHSRIIHVVLHPSIQSLTPDLLSEIHNKIRCFEMQVRGQGSSRCKQNESVPVLDGVQRIQTHVDSDEKAIKSEAMRANGFVLAKMVRAKLLHTFLWDYLSSASGWDDAVSFGKHVPGIKHQCSSCYLFSLEAAVKNIPLELFLQVAGSTQKFDDMIEKCKSGLSLSDLPIQEYRLMMNTQATGRLSLIVDILRRLKLIRLVSSGHSDDGIRNSHANLTHALEIKPYIEEPPSIAATSNLTSHDLRPRIRHDFILSNREAVNEYWKTLEYCYAAADPRAALRAFPGSAVHDVFRYHSWASVRVMTADQRAELLKRIVKDNICEKIPYKECEKIAKDLNLTLEQVLRVYYYKLQKRLSRFQGASAANSEEYQPRKDNFSSRKRQKSLEERSLKQTRVGGLISATALDTANKFMEEQNPDAANSAEHGFQTEDGHPETVEQDVHLETVEEPESNEEDEECHNLLSQRVFSKMKQSRQKRFLWTDATDRQLVVQYVRHRAALGAKFHRVDWAALPNLPASPRTCARRMSLLKRNRKLRKALMKLCNMLGERYAKHLEKMQNMPPNKNDCKVLMQSLLKESLDPNDAKVVKHTEDSCSEGNRWDDFNDKSVERALEEVIQLKQIAKLEASDKVQSISEERSNILEESELVSPTTSDDHDLDMEQHKDAARRSKSRHFHQKFIKLLNERTNANPRVLASLAVSNAVELFKIAFLSTSTAPELQNLVAETLRHYSEHDLFAAFSYLRERKFMIGGNGSPFVLSQVFLQSLSKSPFPINTGKRAANFCSWLYEHEKDLMGGGINLNADLQCGDIFHLFSLVSSGELTVSPCLPDEGVGEAEDLRCLKRKSDDNELCANYKGKKLRCLTEGELISRREKGFPGIMVSISRATILAGDAVELFKDGETCASELNRNAEFNSTMEKYGGSFCLSDHTEEVLTSVYVPKVGSSSESPWDVMTTYAEYLSSHDRKQVSLFSPQVFKAVYSSIQKAGDQGLSIEEISLASDMPENIIEHVIDALQVFGRALKVNAYDSVRVVDALYRSKYFLTSMGCFCQDVNRPSLTKILDGAYNSYLVQPENYDKDGANYQDDMKMNIDDVHKVTILNLPEDAEALDETQTGNLRGDCMPDDDLLRSNNEDKNYKPPSTELCTPILPWINGDGTVNSSVYNGLLRRIFGTVMQNPGILEDEIIRRTDVINLQSCKKLLELMLLDGHLIVRKMHQTTYSGSPPILGSLLGNSFKNSKMVYREHYFANPKSTSIL